MPKIKGDDPIRDSSEDLLGRARLAEVIAAEIRNIDASEGFVVGVLGPWGSGKTSLINLILKKVGEEPKLTVLAFNPWMFSGSDQLVESFFIELAAQLRSDPSRLQNIANNLYAYGEVFSPLGSALGSVLASVPVAGIAFTMFGSATKTLNNYYKNRKKGVAETRNNLTGALRELTQPIIVVIDDVDRLRTSEIRDIFKLVRLTANLPNIIYVLAFDRLRVEKALYEGGLSGRDYLEKIIQVTYDIPAIPSSMLSQQIIDAINSALADVPNRGPFEEKRWQAVFREIMMPLFRNMRDVRRYGASLPGTVRSLDGKVSLVDVLALEAIRVFMPDLFAAVIRSQQALTVPEERTLFDRLNDSEEKQSIGTLMKVAGEQKHIAEAMIERLFPAAVRHLRDESYDSSWMVPWTREKRVARRDFLKLYLERVAADSLKALSRAEQAVAVSTDSEELAAFFESLDPDEWADVIRALEFYEGDFPKEAVVPTVLVLLNLMPNVPKRARNMFELDAQYSIRGIVYRLLRQLPSQDEAESAIRSAIPNIGTLTSRLALLDLVKPTDDGEPPIIDESTRAELELKLRNGLRTASPETVAQEPSVFWLLSWWKGTNTPAEEPFNVPSDIRVRCALLKGAVWITKSQSDGPVEIKKSLNWEALLDLMGSEEDIRGIVDSCNECGGDESLSDALELAEKYLSGWRPPGP